MATLILICGMAGAGKTTLARQLEVSRQALRLSPDEWIKAVLKDETDQAELDRLRDPVEMLQWSVARQLLGLGLNVILENGFWGKKERARYLTEARVLGARVELHYLNVSREELWTRLQARNAQSPSGSFLVAEHELETWLSWFTPPDREEASCYDDFFEHKSPRLI